MSKLSYTREIPVTTEVDIFIGGGGPAGIVAAIAAARQGATVCLVDEGSCLGGMMALGWVPAFSGLSDGVNFMAGGIGKEIYDKLDRMGGIVSYNAVKIEILKRIYDDMIIKAGVRLLLLTKVIDITLDSSSRLSNVILASKSGIFSIKAKIFIDCTGDGEIGAKAGAPFLKGDDYGRMMAATLCSLWAGIDWDQVYAGGRIADDTYIEDAYRNGVLPGHDRHLPGMWRIGKNLGGGNIGHLFDVDSTDEESLTQALISGRKLVMQYEQYYKTYLKGFKNMELVGTAPIMGVREGRRFIGDYILSVDDYVNRASFDDEIGRFAYPIDIHASNTDAESFREYEKFFIDYRYEAGENYGIPYRILTTKGFDNLLVAGRCVSADRYMMGSLRVTPGCYITGQAAGIAAALALNADNDIRAFDIGELQVRLKDMGAFMPNFKQAAHIL